MKYFSGFSLQDESGYFSDYLVSGEFTVVGFSYGAQQAFEYVYESKERIERLILLSPAFFQSQKHSFVRTQLRYFEADRESYVKQFLANVSYPSSLDISKHLKPESKEALASLLTYIWDIEKIKEVSARGTVIEVFLGEEDKIIVPEDVLDFFEPLVPVYTIKSVGHLLQKSCVSQKHDP